MYISIHKVKEVRTRVKELHDGEGKPFYLLEIGVTDDSGAFTEITLFSNAKDTLAMVQE